MKFKKGDVVFLSKDSEFANNGVLPNPLNTKGVILNVYDYNLGIYVKWSGIEQTNSYNEIDLVPLSEKPISDYVGDIRILAKKRNWNPTGNEFVTKKGDDIIIKSHCLGKYIELYDDNSEKTIGIWLTEMINYCFLNGKGKIIINRPTI